MSLVTMLLPFTARDQEQNRSVLVSRTPEQII